MIGKLIDRNWLYRRLGIFGTLSFCWITGFWIVFRGADTRLMQDAFQAICLLQASTLVLYVTGSVVDHKNEGKEALQAKAIDQTPVANTDTSVEVKS